MSPDAIKLLEHIAQRLEILANDKQWLKRLSNGLTGLGCRSSLTECLRGFSTVLEELRYHKPDSARSLQQSHERVLSFAKSIDQKVKQGQKNLSFDTLALQTSLFLFVKKLRHIAKMARDELECQEATETKQNATPAKPERESWLWKLYEKTLKVIIDAVLGKVWHP